jgi:hypothetical protein
MTDRRAPVVIDPADRAVQAEASRLRAEHGFSWDKAHTVAYVTRVMRAAGVQCYLTDDFLQ